MSVGSLVASGIGILMLIITAYILVGGTLGTAELVVMAQGDLAVQQEIRMRTNIDISATSLDEVGKALYVEVANSGNEPIVNFEHMDVYLVTTGSPVYCSYGTDWSVVGISPDSIHPGQLDPGEVLNLSVTYAADAPTWVQVTTGNGVYDSAYI
ncbi:flagellar protein FlaF [Methanoculleus sp. FWC-SCC1]|uniref:Flagellar protein FlaF n=1 Tax=Methanoculleus frigidifontis TaxID=2584085 RepID=A0ABT8M621_9EURY|nr:flagellar protein FlaF [Methanoculleus sp. FWC-SCC1]MDN7023382.1 flagellar protein FlaF [Methanoculleus sp. FWC-SCC1]